MNNMKKVFAGLALVLTCGVQSSMAQIVVRVRPERPHYERTVAPSPRHVWVDEEWTPRGDKYEFSGGRWAEPNRRGARWAPGHWRETPQGHSWHEGHWRR